MIVDDGWKIYANFFHITPIIVTQETRNLRGLGFVDPERMNERQPSIPKTLCLLQGKVNHLTPTIQNLWELTNALEQDPRKRATNEPRISLMAE